MSRSAGSGERCFPFEFDRLFRPPLTVLGVRPQTAAVLVGAETFAIRFGPWRLATARENVTGANIIRPLRWWRVIGPRLSLADRGVTFGTTTNAGVCVRFATPVAALIPGGWLTHPAATVTVTDPDLLVACLTTT